MAQAEVVSVTVRGTELTSVRLEQGGELFVAVRDVARVMGTEDEQLLEAADTVGVRLVRATYALKMALGTEEEGDIWLGPLEELQRVLGQPSKKRRYRFPLPRHGRVPSEKAAAAAAAVAATVWSFNPLGAEAFPLPESEQAPVATAHMGAAMVGGHAHPSALHFDRANSALQNVAINATFNAMLSDLWPPSMPPPDTLTRHLLLQSAVRCAARSLESKFEQTLNLRRGKWILRDMPEEMQEELQKLDSDAALMTAVFGNADLT